MSRLSQEQVVAVIVMFLLLVFALALPGFATASNILGLVRSISILGILGLGMGLIVISRGIDLSEVAIMAGGWCVALIANQHGLPPLWTAVLALGIAIGIGVINGVMVAFVEVPALFVTLATTFVVYGVAYWIAPVYVVYAPQNAPALLFAGRGAARHTDADFVFAAARCHPRLPVADLDRPLHLCAGRQPRGGALFRHCAASPDRLEHILVRPLAWLAGLVWIGQTGSMQMTIVQGTQIFDVILVVVLGGMSLVGGRGGCSASWSAAR